MNMKNVLIVIVCVLTLNTAVMARRKPQVETPAVPAVTHKIAQLSDEYRDIKLLVEKAQREASTLQRQALNDMKVVERRLKKRKTRLDRRREEALRKDEERFAVTQDRAAEELEQIKKDAERRAIELVRDAELKALDLRDKLEAQEKEDQEKAKIAITSEWKEEIRAEFARHTSFVKTIILAGEASRLERDNFVHLFEKQREWFENTVTSVQHFFDEQYAAAMAKKNALSVLVDAQQQADEIIADVVLKNHLPKDVSDKLRVLALYEINTHLQTSKGDHVFLPVEVINTLVQTVIKTVSPEYREVTILSEREQIEQMRARIAHLEAELDANVGKAEKSQKVAHAALKAQERIAEHAREQVQAAEKEKEKIAQQVKAEVTEKHKKEMARLQDVAQENEEESEELKDKLTITEEELKITHNHISDLRKELAALKQQHSVEQQRMNNAIKAKEQEYRTAQENLKKSKRFLLLVKGKTREELARMGGELMGTQVREAHITKMLEAKQKEQRELEALVSALSQELQYARTTAEETIDDVVRRLEQKAQEADTLTDHVMSIQGAMEGLSADNAALRARLQALKHEVAQARGSVPSEGVSNDTLFDNLVQKIKSEAETVRAHSEPTAHGTALDRFEAAMHALDQDPEFDDLDDVLDDLSDMTLEDQSPDVQREDVSDDETIILSDDHEQAGDDSDDQTGENEEEDLFESIISYVPSPREENEFGFISSADHGEESDDDDEDLHEPDEHGEEFEVVDDAASDDAGDTDDAGSGDQGDQSQDDFADQEDDGEFPDDFEDGVLAESDSIIEPDDEDDEEDDSEEDSDLPGQGDGVDQSIDD